MLNSMLSIHTKQYLPTIFTSFVKLRYKNILDDYSRLNNKSIILYNSINIIDWDKK